LKASIVIASALAVVYEMTLKSGVTLPDGGAVEFAHPLEQKSVGPASKAPALENNWNRT
jgi:hypothetical protein